MSKARSWAFTINNWTQSDEDALAALRGSYKYLVVGREGKDTDTPHLQCYVTFKSPRALSGLKKLLPRAHLEIANGNAQSNLDYCSKEGDFCEDGVLPSCPKAQGATEKRRWDEIRIAAEEGRVEDIPDEIRFNQPRIIEYHYRQAQKRIKLVDSTTHHLWYYGGTGTGKSRKARTDHPDAYLKMCNKWWCDYDQSIHKTVIIEDFDKKHEMLCHHLKIWGDRYPFPAEYKGGKFDVRPDLIIVTSNYHPNEIWSDPSDLEPILRRFKVVRFLPDLMTNKD